MVRLRRVAVRELLQECEPVSVTCCPPAGERQCDCEVFTPEAYTLLSNSEVRLPILLKDTYPVSTGN